MTTAKIKEDAQAIITRISNREKKAYLDTGRDLVKLKAMLKHGDFEEAVEKNFTFSLSTAGNYMRAAELVSKHATVADLRPGAVIALAAPSTPDSVVLDIVAEIAAGNVPDTDAIKAKIAAAKAPKKTSKRVEATEKPKEAKSEIVATLPATGASKPVETAAKPVPAMAKKAKDETVAATTSTLARSLEYAGPVVALDEFRATFPRDLVFTPDEVAAELVKAIAAMRAGDLKTVIAMLNSDGLDSAELKAKVDDLRAELEDEAGLLSAEAEAALDSLKDAA